VQATISYSDNKHYAEHTSYTTNIVNQNFKTFSNTVIRYIHTNTVSQVITEIWIFIAFPLKTG